jgi:hypothetical protein
MRNTRSALAGLVLAGALGMSGCERPDVTYETGEVTKISKSPATLVANPKWNGMVSYSNETVKIGSPVVLLDVSATGGKEYTIEIGDDNDPAFPGQQTVHNLMSRMKIGSDVKFAVSAGKGYVNVNESDVIGAERVNIYLARDYFNSSGFGVLDPDAITIIGE